MQILAYQIALFPEDSDKSPLKNPSGLIADVSKAVNDSVGINLDKQNIFPEVMAQTDQNPNIPRLIASSKDDSVVLQATTKRINLTNQITLENASVSEEIFWKMIEEVIKSPSFKNIKFDRLGYIRTYLFDTDEFTPYAEAILATGWKSNIDSFNTQLGYRPPNKDLNINISIASVTKHIDNKKAVQMQIDVNTIEGSQSMPTAKPLDLLKKLANKKLTSQYTGLIEKVEKANATGK